MDTITQAALGATVGQAFFGRRLGRGAALWGALAGTIPDLDVFAATVGGPMAEMIHHRGTTHALWFGPVVGTVLGWAVWRRHAGRLAALSPSAREAWREKNAARARHPGDRSMLSAWIGLFVLALFTHPLLDVFTTYGTQLFAPFSPRRFAVDAVAIIDPAYTVPLFVAIAIGWAFKRRPAVGVRAAAVALALTTAYLFYCLHLNHRAEAFAARDLEREGVVAADVRAYPTLLQPYYRRVVAKTPARVYVGYVTMWRPHPIRWRSFAPAPAAETAGLRATRLGATFDWFAMRQTAGVVHTKPGGRRVAELIDLRYGMPGPPDRGFWRVSAAVDEDGRVVSEPEFERTRPRDLGVTFTRLWHATWDGEGNGTAAGGGGPR